MIGIQYYKIDGGHGEGRIDHHADTCPICNFGIDPKIENSLFDIKKVGIGSEFDESLQIVYRCPRESCRNFFISYFTKDNGTGYFRFRRSAPQKERPRVFSETIKALSPSFCRIYNQSLTAENFGLSLICGVGYRKALEFLLKDYFIKIHPDKSGEIKEEWLGKCIEKYTTDKNVLEVAKRATWLGNDETHYNRIWEGKDLSDLKRLIDLTLHWIEAEQLTSEAIEEMPAK